MGSCNIFYTRMSAYLAREPGPIFPRNPRADLEPTHSKGNQTSTVSSPSMSHTKPWPIARHRRSRAANASKVNRFRCPLRSPASSTPDRACGARERASL